MKKFRVNIILRISIITLLVALVVYYLIVKEYYLRSTYLMAFVIMAFFEFIRYVEKTNRDFKIFLTGILQDDFTTTFSEKARGKSFNELYAVMNGITRKFKEVSAAKAAQHLYLEALVAHVRVGIISYDGQERIHLMNDTAKKLLQLPRITHLTTLKKVNSTVYSAICEIKPGQNHLLKIMLNNEIQSLSIHASQFKLQNKYYKLISVQNIKNELDMNEMVAWQRLIRVLTHEIMNSVTPIHSLSSTLKQIVENNASAGEQIPNALREKLWTGLDAVENRSKGLRSFTQAYRKLTHLPTPKFEEVDLGQQVRRLTELMKNDLKGINVMVELGTQTTVINADPDLLDQALINLIKNAIEALTDTENPELVIRVDQTPKIVITDNGIGIEKDKLEEIFIPFFTTKKEGSGIGLALTRQIIKLHNGSISVKTTPGSETSFTITF